MLYKPSRCICIETPNHKDAVKFYHDILGLNVVEDHGDSVELDAEPFRLFVDKADQPAVAMEFAVPDAEAARAELEEAGCTVVKWEGKGKCCYMKDPFGLVFNLWEV